MAAPKTPTKKPNILADIADILIPRQEKGLLSDWILEKGLITPSGIPYEFDAHLFLRDIVNDWTPLQAIPKGAQMGVTENLAIKTIYAAAHRQWNIIYTLPSDDDISQFVPSKLNMIVSRNKPLAELITPGQSMSRKQIGTNFIYYRGTRGMTEAVMISSDLNVYDEVDRADQETITTYESRLAFSKYKGQWWLSNLSAPGRGVDAEYEKSDKKHWHITCPKCRAEQYMSWPESVAHEIDENTLKIGHAAYVCKSCHSALSDENRSNGRWVAHETSDISGYWLNHLMCAWINAREIVKAAYKPGGQAYFHNFVLGLAYRGSDATVDADVIYRSMRQVRYEDYSHLPVAMGIDTGNTWHVVIGCEAGIFDIRACSESEAKNLYAQYKPVTVIDLKGDTTATRQLINENKGRVFGCDYKRDKEDRDTVRWATGDKFGVVYADRSRIIDDTIDDFRQGRIPILNMNRETLGAFVKHWESLYKVRELDSMGIAREKWEHNGPDHFAHAATYFKIALSKIKKRGVTVTTDARSNPKDFYHTTSLDYVINNQRKGKTKWMQI